MNSSIQGIPNPAGGRVATLGVAAMLLVAGLFAATLATPGAGADAQVGPSVKDAVFRDVDNDGYLDAVDVTFDLENDKAIVASTVRPFDFTVVVDAQTSLTPHGCLATTTNDVIHCDGQGTDTFRLYFAELEVLNGALVPDLLYAGGATDEDGGDATEEKTGDVTETTEATPFFLRAYGAEGSTKMVYWFTEPVQPSPSTNEVLDPKRDPKNAVCLANDDEESETPTYYSSGLFDVSTPRGDFDLNKSPSGDDRATILDASLQIGLTGGTPDGSCLNNVGIVDGQGNAVGNNQPLNFQQPITLKGAFGSPGSNELILALDGPVEAPDGQPLELADITAAFTYDDNNGVGASAITGFRHQPGSSRIVLELDADLAPGDFGTTNPDGIDAVANKLIGAGTSGLASNPVVLEAATNRFLSQAPTADPAEPVVADRWDNVDVAPRVVEAGTADLDGDGKLDAVRVRFDQHVSVAGTGADAAFSVQQRGSTVTAADVTRVVDADDSTKSCPTGAGTAVVAPRPDEVWLCIAPTVLGDDATPHVGFDGSGGNVVDGGGNAAVSFGGLVAADQAGALTLTQVRTLDWFDFDGGAATATAPRRPNGLIDTLELVFSAPVADGYDGSDCVNLNAEEWRVGASALAVFMETYVPRPEEGAAGGWQPGSCMGPQNRRDGPNVYLVFSEAQGWDTSVRPALEHLGDVDGDGRVLSGIATGRFPTGQVVDSVVVDRANPVLLSASASQGHNQITITFSEPVRGVAQSSPRRVVATDLSYLDLSEDEAASITAVDSDAAGSRAVQATMNVAPEATDIGTDAVRPAYTSGTGTKELHPTGSSIQDLSGNKVVYRDFTGTTPVDLAAVVEDNSSPFVTGRVAEDGDDDGFMDRVRVKFNENVRGTGGACPDPAMWSLTVDGDAVAATGVTNVDDPGAACSTADSDVLYVEFDGVAAEAGTDAEVRFSYDPDAGTGAAVEDKDGNPLNPLATQTAVDGASPVLLPSDGGPATDGTDAEAETVDTDGDGVIDALRVLFSEPVAPASLKPGQWSVASSAGTVASLEPEEGSDSVLVRLNVPGGATPDTGATPALTYAPSDATQGVADRAATPNHLSGTRYKGTDSELATVDAAGPVILRTGTGLSGATLTLAFSEPVQNEAGGDVDETDVSYDNDDAATNDVSDAVASVAHDAASATEAHVVKVTFDATPSAEDKQKDRLDIVSILDAAGNEASSTFTSLDGVSNDLEPPRRINNLVATAVAKSATENEITLAWTNPPADSVRGDDLASLVITIDDPDDEDPRVDITSDANDLSDKPTLPAPVAGESRTLTVKGVEAGRTYQFTIRAVDEAGLQGSRSAPASATVPFFDGTAPGAVTGLEAEGTTGSSVTLKWTAPSDKDGQGNTVKVAGYQVRVSSSSITSFSQGSPVAATSLTFVPAGLASPGQEQRVTVTGLEAETTYHFAVRAVDARPNTGAFDTTQATTGPEDATPPTGTLVVSSSTHPPSTATGNDAPTFSWSGLTDPETPITYWYALNQDSDHDVTDEEAETDRSGSTTQTSKGFTDVAEGTWHFHVRGFSQGGSGPTVTYTIIVLDPDDLIDPQVIADANEELQDSLEVSREDGDNTLRWSLPETDEDVAGIQVWRSTSPFELLVDLAAGSGAFDAGEYVDEDAPEDATYVVTLYFSEDPVGGQVEDLSGAPGYDDLTEAQLAERGTEATPVDPPVEPPGGDGLPAWLWVLVAVGLVGVVAAVVVPVVLSRRGREEPEESTWQDRVWGDEAFVTDEEAEAEAAGPEHFVECPRCGHGFEVRGEKPLETTCPECGVKGVLN